MNNQHDKYSRYRYCVVRECKNTSIKTPGKLFIPVPRETNVRNTWLKLSNRDPASLSTTSRIHLCEDHFDLENDMENYVRYKIMGSVKQIRMNPGCVPSRFDCQADRRRKRMIVPAELEHTSKETSVTSNNEQSSGVEMSTSIFHQGIDIEIIDLKNKSAFNMSHFGNTKINKDEATEMSSDFIGIKEEMESEDVKITGDETAEAPIEYFTVKKEVDSFGIGENFAPIDESITVVKHEVDDYTLETIKIELPKNKVLYSGQNFETDKKLNSCNELKTDMITDVGVHNFLCEFCEENFNSQSLLNKHLRTHQKAYDFKGHLRKHTSDYPFKCDTDIKKFECEHCKKRFKRKQSLNNHLKIHLDVKNLKCEQCNKGFSQEQDLIRHLNIHSGIFECKHCKKRFKYRQSLHKHSKIHSGIKEFECEYCKKRFLFKQSLALHQKIHLDVKEFECEQCKKGFSHKHSLVQHLKIHSGIKEFECEYCKKRFIFKHNLKLHQKIHLDVKEFECEQCKKRFSYKHSLAQHLKIHSGIKDFGCEICKMRFVFKHSLTAHRKIHSGVKNFECEHCKKRFLSKSHLNNHRKKVHSAETLSVNTAMNTNCAF